MRRTVFALMMAAGLSWSLPALAQPLQAKRAQVRRQVTEYMMLHLTQELALDAATAERVRAVWQQYQDQIAGVRREMGMATKELKAQLAAVEPDTARLQQLSDIIVADRQRVQGIESQRIAALRNILTPAQFAKAIIVSPKIQRQVRQQIWQLAHPNGAPTPPPDEE